MAILINNIRIDGSDKREDWDPLSYERAVERIIHQVRSSETGRIVLNSLRMKSTIIPYPAVLPVNADVNITSSSRNQGRTGELNVIAPSYQYRARQYTNSPGSDTLIRYTPGHWIQSSRHYHKPGNAAHTADGTLVHELMHAIRFSLGLLDRRPMTSRSTEYPNHTEFYATLIENIYASENNRRLRQNYVSSNAVGSMSMLDFYDNPGNVLLMLDLFRTMPVFCQKMSRVSSLFNPFRDHVEELNGLNHRTNLMRVEVFDAEVKSRHRQRSAPILH